MKDLLRLLPITALTIFLTGCYTNVINLDENENGGSGNGQGNGLVVNDPSQLSWQISAESKVCEVNFNSGQGWSVTGIDDNTRKWVTLSTSGSDIGGYFTLDIIVDENTSGADRIATLQLFSGSEIETITIFQSSKLGDGSEPQPYVEDYYSDVVVKIVSQSYIDGVAEPWIKEWRFTNNTPSGQINGIASYVIDQYTEREEEQILVNDYNSIEHISYGLVGPAETYGILHRQHREMSVNIYNFILHQYIREFNYFQTDDPNKSIREEICMYSNYYIVLQKDDSSTKEYRWVLGNMTEQEEVNTSNIVKFSYNAYSNNRTNLDLNAFFNGDIYKSIGLFGKRSENLISSISDYKGGVYHLDYSFDEKGRVQTVTRKFSFNGVFESGIDIYTIYYSDNLGR